MAASEVAVVKNADDQRQQQEPMIINDEDCSGDGWMHQGGSDGRFTLKAYKRRWLMMALFVLYSTTINGQWVQYSIISNIVTRYYNVSSFAVDCSAMSYMFYYVPFVFPASWLSERFGVRKTLILGSVLSCSGAWIKSYATTPRSFHVALVGQSVVATTQALMLPIPGRLAAKWFGSHELSTATSIGVFGTQLGIAVSFLLPPMMVGNHEDPRKIGRDLANLSHAAAIAASLTLLAVVLLFQEEPELPPSETRAFQKAKEEGKVSAGGGSKEGFLQPIGRLLGDHRSFFILCHSYGLSIGVLNAVATLLNQMFLARFENGEEDAGRIGLLMIVAGMVGSVLFGAVLDKTHKFKETTVTVYFSTLCGQILFAAAMILRMKRMVYVAATFLGFFMSGYLALGYEMAAEYTYPESESNTAGILNVANNVYGIVLVVTLSRLMEAYGDAPAHAGLCFVLLVGLVLTVATKDEQRRQDARRTMAADCR
ncbi:feline leukemia virus subgroup C receptor-related protein 2-like [Copidosoma floridanum]|uniref:feline leukemia virus subgroup C receptor-related protein 2-like n=1 Tax=Copidosoma floridanum TaxID=29053 RepID=UPI0006C99C36|nr:feline leukemia virus subgroup C receptor-related protein 2-like [Copidosoma floridanum]